MLSSSLFQQSLQDLVKGLRSNRRTEAVFIQEKLVTLADEARSSDPTMKSTAVLKLIYLQMLGHSIGFASFPIIETISNSSFPIKRIGYLAAAQSFSPTTDVLLLATNQFKKDLTNGRLQDCSQALTCLAKLINEQLGRDVEHDLEMLLKSPRPYIRKKALLVLYRLILVHEGTLPVVAPRLRELLSDPDSSVVCAAVTVVCELARKSPSAFLPLAPVLYGLLTTSTNNWMLIKIVSLLGVLTPIEPRLAKKLLPHLLQLMRTTRAKSLLYECCSTVTLGLNAYQEAIDLCAMRLGEFLVDDDQNLKYLGLVSMARLVNTHRDAAVEHRDLILDCLDDEDITIRMKALDLVSQLVSKRSLRGLCSILLRKLQAASSASTATELAVDSEAPYRAALAERLLSPGTFIAGTGYEGLETESDFEWYLKEVLAGLAQIRSLPLSAYDTIGAQFIDIVGRVEEARGIAVLVAIGLLSPKAEEQDDIDLPARVISAIAWLIGEHGTEAESKSDVVEMMIGQRFDKIHPDAQVRLITAAVKLLSKHECDDASFKLFSKVRNSLARLWNSERPGVQERAWLLCRLLDCGPETVTRTLGSLFKEVLRPVDVEVQRTVVVPEGLDLDTPLMDVQLDDALESDDFAEESALFRELQGDKDNIFAKRQVTSAESTSLLKDYGTPAPSAGGRNDPFYLGERDNVVKERGSEMQRKSREVLNAEGQDEGGGKSTRKVNVFVGDSMKSKGTKERNFESEGAATSQNTAYDGLFDNSRGLTAGLAGKDRRGRTKERRAENRKNRREEKHRRKKKKRERKHERSEKKVGDGETNLIEI